MRWPGRKMEGNSLLTYKKLSGNKFDVSSFSVITVAYFLIIGFQRVCACAKSLQSWPTLCDPMDCSPAGSSVHGILQARILEWIAMSHSRVSSQPRDQSCISYMSCVYFNNFFFSFLKSPLSQIRSHSLMSRHHSGHYGHRGRRHNLQGQLVQLHLFLGMHQSRALVLFWYHLSLL